MPIERERAEPGVYMLHWTNTVTMDEVRASHDGSRAEAEHHGEAAYVHILNMAEVIQFPYNVRGYINILEANPNCIGVVLVKPPAAAGILVRAMANLIQTPVLRVFDSMKGAQAEARVILQAHLQTE